jgi:hypothetical protein
LYTPVSRASQGGVCVYDAQDHVLSSSQIFALPIIASISKEKLVAFRQSTNEIQINERIHTEPNRK